MGDFKNYFVARRSDVTSNAAVDMTVKWLFILRLCFVHSSYIPHICDHCSTEFSVKVPYNSLICELNSRVVM